MAPYARVLKIEKKVALYAHDLQIEKRWPHMPMSLKLKKVAPALLQVKIKTGTRKKISKLVINILSVVSFLP